MKIDLHVHCRERSPCGKAPEEEQIRQAIENGLDAIAFTDHHHFMPLSRLRALNERYAPFRIFNGIEATADGEDFLVFGARHGRLETFDWHYPDLYEFVRARGGYLVLAHPFRFSDKLGVDIATCPPDAIEGRSNNIDPGTHARIGALARAHGLPVISASDAHHTFALGRHYIDVEGDVVNETELFRALAAGQYTCAR